MRYGNCGALLEESFIFDPLDVFNFVFPSELDGDWSMLISGNGLPAIARSDAGTNGGYSGFVDTLQQGPSQSPGGCVNSPESGMEALFGLGLAGLGMMRRRRGVRAEAQPTLLLPEFRLVECVGTGDFCVKGSDDIRLQCLYHPGVRMLLRHWVGSGKPQGTRCLEAVSWVVGRMAQDEDETDAGLTKVFQAFVD